MQASDFIEWTKEERMKFDNIRQIAFQPTKEEMKQQEDNLLTVVKEKLSVYWIEFTGEEKDLSSLYEVYIKGDWTEINKPMNERLWDDDRLEEIINEKKSESNDVMSFCNFVLSYET